MLDDSFNNLTVLLVDDEKFSRVTVAGMLADLGRPTVLEAENGADALAVLGKHKVDFIISDFNMPVVHGLQLLQSVRAGELPLNKPDTPFALLTGYSEQKLVELALALDANAFLVKPVSKDGLRKRLSKMLSLVKSDKWLKDSKTYADISVGSLLDEIANPNASGKPPKLMPKGQPLIQSAKPTKTSGASAPADAPLKVRGPGGSRRPDSGPIEVRGLDGKRRPDSGPIEVRGLDGQYRPDSGPIEVRGYDGKYRPASGKVEVRGRPNAPGKTEVPEGAKASEIEVLGVEIETAKTKNVDKHLCPLDDLPENAVLALDVFTMQGTLYMHAGTELTPRIVSLLYNLHELGHPVESIWIEYQEGTR